MQPEFCPFHRCVDTCVPVARVLTQAGLLDPAPNVPVAAGSVMGIPAVPALEVTLALLAHRINQWGRVVIDPTLPYVEVAAADERSMRYTLQALWEEGSAGVRRMIGTGDLCAPQWWRVRESLHSAHAAAARTTSDDGQDDRALWWYIALLHLDRAHAVWKQGIGRPLVPGGGHT
ncbi:hypothetical protein ACFQ2B_00345 [Streptomyces stramineus]|uniref:Uncharacterized protein n=1 Tax=Streptomyces stramineus TaxID=173861 RepID=A0ABN0ZDS9_9ACTN